MSEMEISSFLQKNPTILRAVMAAQKGIKAGGKADPQYAPPAVLNSPRAVKPEPVSEAPRVSDSPKASAQTVTPAIHPHSDGPLPEMPKKVVLPPMVVAKNGRWFK
jgi:hypothetical protein